MLRTCDQAISSSEQSGDFCFLAVGAIREHPKAVRATRFTLASSSKLLAVQRLCCRSWHLVMPVHAPLVQHAEHAVALRAVRLCLTRHWWCWRCMRCTTPRWSRLRGCRGACCWRCPCGSARPRSRSACRTPGPWPSACMCSPGLRRRAPFGAVLCFESKWFARVWIWATGMYWCSLT